MFSGLKKMIGAIDVYEEGNHIIIEGIPSFTVLRDIRRIWHTERININMFSKVSSSKIAFFKFFALDVVYALETILKDRKSSSNRRAIGRMINELYENTWLKNLNHKHPDIIDFNQVKNLSVTLLPHQFEFLQHYNRVVPSHGLNGMLLSADPGTGKTIACLAASLCLHADVVIVVAPNNSIYKVWKETIENVIHGGHKAWVSQDGKPIDNKHKYYVFHYEALDKALELAKTFKYKNPVVILDECHNFNEPKSLRTQMFIELCSTLNSRHVIWSSGTPLKAIGNEMIPLLTTIDPLFNKFVEERFKNIYGLNASRAVDILRNRLGLLTFKVSKDVVMKGKPIITDIKVKIPNWKRFTLETIREDMKAFIEERMKYYRAHMDYYVKLYEKGVAIHEKEVKHRPKQAQEDFNRYRDYIKTIRRGYDPVTMKDMVIFCNKYELGTLLQDLPSEMRNEWKDCRSVVKYVELKVQGECLGRVLGKRRQECNVALIEHVDLPAIIDDSVKKTVIFSSYDEVVEQIDKLLTKKGYKPALVYGATNKDVTGIVSRFEKDINVNPAVATFQSLSTAVPLIVANTIVMMNTPFRSYEFDQTVARCNRLGQDTQVYVMLVLLDTGSEDNISSRNLDIMEWSMKQVEAIMGTPAADLSQVGVECFSGVEELLATPKQKPAEEPTMLLEEQW